MLGFIPRLKRKLLRSGKASVFKHYPFTIVLHDREWENSTVLPCDRIP
ncbi:RRXRR domain-containing protein [Coleofasciculus sp. D1-CHI-01]